MTTLTEYYNIHNLVSISIRRPIHVNFIEEFSQPFRYFQVPTLGHEPDIILEIGDFEPDNQGCYLVDHQFHVRENYLFCEDTYRAARWKVEINGFERDQTFIRIAGTYKSIKQIIAPGMIWQSLLLKQVIAFHLSQKGYYLIHGAAAAKNGQAIVLFGRGGAYKTTLLMALLRQHNGWQIMGDDTVIVGNGQVLSFPALIGIFAFRHKNLSTEHLSNLDRLRLLFFLTHFNSKDIMIIDESNLAGLVQCTVSANNNISLKKLEISDNLYLLTKVSAAEDHSNYNIGHTSIYPRYVEAYTYIFPENLLTKRWNNLASQVLNQNKSIQSFVLSLSYSSQPHHFTNAIQMLENKIER